MSKDQVINLDGNLTGQPVRFTFPKALDIKNIRLAAFTTSSPAVPISDTFQIKATREGLDLEDFTATGHFMTIEDVLANAMGKRNVTLINRGSFQLITYLHTDNMIADLEVDQGLGSLHGVPPNANGRCTITTSPWNSCNLRKEPYVYPVAFVYIENTYSKDNTRPVLQKARIVDKFLLGTIAIEPGSPVRFKPEVEEQFPLNEKKAELVISVMWQNDVPFLTETSTFYMQVIYN